MPGYKDDLEAAHERIESLEREVARLRGADPQEPAGAPRPAGAVRLGAGLALVAAGGLGVVGILLLLVFPSHEAPLFFAMFAAAAVCGLVLLAVAGRFVLVLRPWQAAIVSGMGARVTVGGRLIRLPVVQQLYLMDLRARLIDWSLVGAPARDATPVDARGHVAYAIEPVAPDIQRAAERFLGRDSAEIDRVVRELAEDAARSVIAFLAPDDLALAREAVNDQLRRELGMGLEGLGMKVLSVGLIEATAGGQR